MVEIAEEIGIPLSEVACALDAVSEPVSFTSPCTTIRRKGRSLSTNLPTKGNERKLDGKIALYEALKDVPEREMQVVRLRYFDGKTQIEISKLVGISQAQVSRLEKSAIKRIRACMD